MRDIKIRRIGNHITLYANPGFPTHVILAKKGVTPQSDVMTPVEEFRLLPTDEDGENTFVDRLHYEIERLGLGTTSKHRDYGEHLVFTHSTVSTLEWSDILVKHEGTIRSQGEDEYSAIVAGIFSSAQEEAALFKLNPKRRSAILDGVLTPLDEEFPTDEGGPLFERLSEELFRQGLAQGGEE